ncbi:exonuclease SbcCD subunit D C-terminal domain-containing protein [Chitinibacter bivalviorum]|uniref:exonuclease SbcCD subunit D C-terminal domain-containing protein n=1 Tax=Chitinibacter bivalviorum TaxID=2739434 RepID=UPI002483DDD5|nr:exonuclease SbcCD subunit D C-terminal domain-containing protein [Chitinibacter bivalviorum]
MQTAAQSAQSERPVWLEVTVRGDDYLSDLQPRIQALTESLPVEVLRIRRDRSEVAARLHAEAKVTLDELSPDEVFAKRLEQEDLPEDLTQQLKQRYQNIVSLLREEQA